MKKSDVINTYKLLGHNSETELRLIYPRKDINKSTKILFVKTEKEFIKVCEKYDGEYNIYAGINERTQGGTEAVDVISCSTIVIDVDPVRSNGIKNDPSTQEELDNSLITAKAIVARLVKEDGLLPPSIAMSGNGVQLWYKIPLTQIIDSNREDVESRIKKFISNIQNEYNDQTVHIDQIGDLPRIIKVIGTKSIKGNQTIDRPHRESCWLSITGQPDQKLLSGINNYDVKTLSSKKQIDTTDRVELLKLFSNEENKLFFEGIIDGKPSRSEPEYALVMDLIKKFVPKEKIFAIMELSKTGKWNESSNAYKEKTYDNALREIREDHHDITRTLVNMPSENIKDEHLSKNNQQIKKKYIVKELPKPSIEDGCDFIMSSIKEGFCDETFQVWIVFVWGQEEYFAEVTSQLFEDFVRLRLFNGMGYVRDNWVRPIIHTIESKYRNTHQRKLFLRTGWYEQEMYYQISKNTCVVVSPKRCEIIRSPYIFRTFQTQIDQTIDLTATIEDYKLLEKYTNFSSECEKELFFDILPAFFIPEISKPIILVKGEAGSAKSTLLKIMKKIIDPNLSLEDGISIPKDQKDWYVIGRQHCFIFFDNVSKIEPEDQDTCCRIIQGWNMEVRKLFTDNQTMYAWLKNGIGINAIELEALQSDFLDRSLIFELKRITDEKRKGDEQFKQELNKDLPKILGAIFKIIQKALGFLPSIKNVPQSLRLLDFVKYSAAISAVRGRTPKEFLDALTEKTLLQKEESIEQSLIGQPVIKFMEDKAEWTGKMSDLVTCILKQEYGEIITENGYEKSVIGHVPRHFPQDPRSFGRELTRIGFILKSKGILSNKNRSANGRLISLKNEYLVRNPEQTI